VPPVAVVLIVDSSDVDAASSQNVLHGLSADHGQLHELDRFLARKAGSILYRHFRVDDQMSPVTAANMRTIRSDDLEML
jgi:hypothetical protein